MAHVIFVVPFALPATLRFAEAAASLEEEGVVLGIVSQEPASRLPASLRTRIRGFQQVGSALDADVLTEGVRAAARQMGGQVDRLLGILEPMQETLAEVRERLGIPGTRGDVARNFRDKAHMKDLLRQGGIPCARHRLCASSADAFAFAGDIGFPLVVKPPAGAGARDTFRVETEDQLGDCLRSLPARPDAPLLIEEFLSGEEFSFDTVTLAGRHLLHSVSEYTPTPLEVMRTPWIQWNVLLPREIDGERFETIHRIGPKALDLLGIETGITHLEWFRRADGSVAVSEVAARPPGAQITSLLGYAHDDDFYRAWVRLVALDRFDMPERKYAAGAAYLRGQGDGHVVDVAGLGRAQEELGELVVEASLPKPGQAKASGYEGEGFVILRHRETEKVRQGLRRLVTLLQVELA